MPLGRATAIVRPAIHGIWMKESTVLCGVQVCNLRTLQKNQIRFFLERFRTTPDSFISKNEGMTEVHTARYQTSIEDSVLLRYYEHSTTRIAGAARTICSNAIASAR